MLSERVGLRIWELRNQKGLTQKNLAQLSKVDRSYLSGVENGKRTIQLDNLLKVCDGLGVTLAEFFEVFIKDVCPDIEISDDVEFDEDKII